jgi:hypothetical protein
MRTTCAMDNGVSGALCILRPDGPVFLKTPTIEQGGRTYIDVVVLSKVLRTIDDPFMGVEQTQLNPTFGAKGNHSQGRSEGAIDAVLKLLAIPHIMVPPRTWMKEMHLGIRRADQDTKSASIEACSRLFPGVDLVPPGCRKPSDAFADSLLIAIYCQRHYA